MSGNKTKSKKAQIKEAKSEEQSSNKETETETKYSGEDLKSKTDPVVTSDGGAHNIFYIEKKGQEHTYYMERRVLTDAKIKQDSYSEVKQYYSRNEKNVGTGIPREREFTPRTDQVITTTHERGNQGVAETESELPPDYGSLFSGQDGGPPS